MLWNGLLLIGGLVVLGLAGEALVKGASRLARSLGISALVVGLTVVAFGTSSPEIAVSVVAGASGHDDIAVSNVVGSNIANLLLVLGLAALARPMQVARNVVRTDAPIMIFVMALFAMLPQNFAMLSAPLGRIERWHGLMLLVGLALYIRYTYRNARAEPRAVATEFERGIDVPGRRAVSIVLIVVGLAGLTAGAQLIVAGARGIAEYFGVAERVIGLTVVAIGTSLPELTTCVIAARRGQPDIAIGNVVGSNIFNVLAVIGIAGSISPLSVNETLLFRDMPVMLGVGVLSFPVMRTGHLISRAEGGVLVALYAAYLTWTVVAQ